MHRGTDVMDESGQGEFSRTHTAADGVTGFEDEHLEPLLCEGDGSR
jgi:hypothetical protein